MIVRHSVEKPSRSQDRHVSASTYLILVENVLNVRRADLNPFKSQAFVKLVGPPGGMFRAKSQDPLYLLEGSGEGVRFGNRRNTFQPQNPMGPKPAIMLVKKVRMRRAGSKPR